MSHLNIINLYNYLVILNNTVNVILPPLWVKVGMRLKNLGITIVPHMTIS